MAESKLVTVSVKTAEKLRGWFKDGRGVRMWINAEIGSGAASEIFTPGDALSPNWRYPTFRTLQPADIQVSNPTILETFRGRIKFNYFGPSLSALSQAKAERLALKHTKDKNSYQWKFADVPGYATIEIIEDHITPFEV
jgi:hypothetical protein